MALIRTPTSRSITTMPVRATGPSSFCCRHQPVLGDEGVPTKFSGPCKMVMLPGVGHFTQREAPAKYLITHFALPK